MSSVLIFGCGNPLRSDDGLGPRAIDLLRARCLPIDVELHAIQHLLPEHASIAGLADLLIFVDASRSGPEGEIRVERVEPEGRFPSPSHHLSPSSLLTLLQQVYGVVPDAYLVTLRGSCFEFGDCLSSSVENRLPELVESVVALSSKLSTA